MIAVPRAVTDHDSPRLASRSRSAVRMHALVSESASMSSLDQSFKMCGLDPGVDDSDHLFDAEAAVCLRLYYPVVVRYMMMMIENLLGLKRCLHVYEGSRMVKPKGRVMTSEKKERQHGPVGNVRTPMLFASFPCAELIIAPTLCSSLPRSCTPMRTGVVTLPRR